MTYFEHKVQKEFFVFFQKNGLKKFQESDMQCYKMMEGAEMKITNY